MKILLVDDSALVRAILKQVISESRPDWSVVGEASHGEDAVKKNLQFMPDLIICDLNMPVMNGLEATAAIMNSRPAGIVIFSNEVDASTAFEALKAGAVDVIRKPDIASFNDASFLAGFLEKLEQASLRSRQHSRSQSLQDPSSGYGGRRFNAVCIGASTGGPAALAELLPSLPADFPVGIALVQHLETGFDRSYADWLNEQSRLEIRLAQDGDRLQPGVCLIAPNGSHLVFSGNRLQLEDSPPVLNQRPAVNKLFSTAAQHLGGEVLAVIMTGMGNDGAAGCVDIVRRGGVVLAQSRESCAVYGMPKAAVEAGGSSRIVPLDQLAQTMIHLAGAHG